MRFVIHRKDLSEPEVREAFEAAGCRWQTIHSPVDAIIAIPTERGCVNVLVETKNPKGAKSGRTNHKKDQQKQIDFLASWPGPIDVVRTAEEAVAVVMKYQQWGVGLAQRRR